MSTTPETLSTPSRKVYIETLGCQMNQSDSELMLGLLAPEGFEATVDRHEADLVIINTCQIRANAEDKAYSYLGAWKKLKRTRPDVKIAMAGCVAQQTKDEVFKRAPYVDFVFGTQNIHQLPDMVQQAFEQNKSHIAHIDKQKPKSTYDYFTDIVPVRKSNISAWVTIIEGCDYFCTYCVVPYTRGRQISRRPESILTEIEQLAQNGYKEVTLLGQTVDSYGKDFDKPYNLADLLYEIAEKAPELKRIRFMTSHPLDLTDDIIDTIAAIPNVMEYIHIPMQAGSNSILDKMRRGYTREQYFDLIDKLRERIPGVAISGDFIVGFPGETEADFEDSMDAVHRVKFDLANVAAYSSRKQTPAGLWEAKGEGLIEQAVKDERLQKLNKLILDMTLERNKAYQGETVELLVEGKSSRKKHLNRWRGRTRTNKVVNFDSLDDRDLTGCFVNVLITEANSSALLGEQVSSSIQKFDPSPQPSPRGRGGTC